MYEVSVIVSATAARRTTTPANIIGDPSRGKNPNTTSDTGMIAVRLHDIHMMVSLREKEAELLDPASLR